MEEIDLNKYQGLWWEIAKFPFKYEKDCDNASAMYIWDQNKLTIQNICYKNFKEISKINGIGYPIPKHQNAIGVVFGENKARYIIVYTDYDNFSIVTSDTRNYLWILSRTFSVYPKQLENILHILKYNGFNISNLLFNKNVIRNI